MTKGKRKNLHVIAHDDKWVIRPEGNSRATSVYNTQREAIDAARKFAINQHSDLVIHGRDGRIRERVSSYRRDPLLPKSPREILFPTTPIVTNKKKIKKVINEVIQESNDKFERASKP